MPRFMSWQCPRDQPFHHPMPRKNLTLPPSQWPIEIKHLTTQAYALDMPTTLQNRIKGPAPPRPAPKTGLVRIQWLQTPGHPAYGQRGLFAAQKIAPATFILDYFGEVHSDERVQSDYDLCISRWSDEEGGVVSIGIDAQFMGNEARFINDYRGTGSLRANAEFRDRIAGGELRMSVWSGPKGLKKGEEILMSYGKGWWAARNKSRSEGSEATEVNHSS